MQKMVVPDQPDFRPIKKVLSKARKLEDSKKQKCYVTKISVPESNVANLTRKKLFIIQPQIISAEICYVPCWLVVLNYYVTIFSKKHKAEGILHFIVDEVKGASVIEEQINLKLEKKNIEIDMLVPHKLTKEQAEKKAIIDARWKVIMAKYKRPPELETVSIKEFYRPYYEVKYTYGSDVKKQWIPADAFGNYFVYR